VPVLSNEALARLLEGNRRYMEMQQVYPRQTDGDRQMLVTGQNPFAAILSCSDSRVPSELIFDQGLGDLFIVRTAGHTVNELVLASLEYAVYVLQVRLVMVLGHQHCGAVTAVMHRQALPGHMPQIVDHLLPAVAQIETTARDAIAQAINANARYTAAEIGRSSPVLADAVSEKRLRIVAACYDLETGRVNLLD